MLTRTYLSRHLLGHLHGTEPFLEYCGKRRIGFEQTLGKAMSSEDDRRWRSALRGLDEATQAQVEIELAQVNELADPDSVALLAEAMQGGDLPPDSVPGDAARALWFLLHHPTVFHEVLL